LSPHGVPPFPCCLAAHGGLRKPSYAGTVPQEDFKGQASCVSADDESVWTDAVSATHVRNASLSAHGLRPHDVSTALEASGDLVLISL